MGLGRLGGLEAQRLFRPDLFPLPGFPGANGFRNGALDPGDIMQGVRGRDIQGLGSNESRGSLAGYGEEALVYPKAAAPVSEGNGKK